ncbi:MAG: right-handed parallel beta-helix repeat-containing protein [Lachnospiraceae bacterium]|nr:right-handed parallel beta-helix repeat-containing protein [Lachnospiraceae bacterium]
MKILQFTEYMERFGDASLAMREAIRDLIPEGGHLVIEPGNYEFYPEMAYEHFYYISNNDKGSKRIAMPLIGARHITVDGNGAFFRFHGKMMPLVLEQCEDICVRNLIVDYDRPFYTEGVVVESSPMELTIKIDSARFPYYVKDERLHFTGWGWDTSRIMNLMQYSPDTQNLELETGDCFLDEGEYTCTSLPDGIRLRLRNRTFPYTMREGNVLVMCHATRENPGIFGTESRDIRFEGVTIHHCEGMAFIFQLCRNICLDGCRVIPSGRRLISACADATHFVSCTGDITLQNCVFESQCDDATNIHGIYTRVQKIVENRMYLSLMHRQQEGVPLYRPGEKIKVLKCDDLMVYGECCITAVEWVNSQLICVEVDCLPEKIELQDGVENITWIPDNVTITGCVTGKNRARSFLISCHGKVRINNNDLSSNGAAIWISGDCNYWYESGPVDDVEIFENRIECRNSQVAGWGRAAVEIVPELRHQTPDYHGRIVINRNEFCKQDGPLIHA